MSWAITGRVSGILLALPKQLSKEGMLSLQLGGILTRSCLQFNVTLNDIAYWLTPQSGFLRVCDMSWAITGRVSGILLALPKQLRKEGMLSLQLGGILTRSCLQFNVTLSDIAYWLTPQSGFLRTVLIVCVCSIFLLSVFCSDAHDWAISKAESNHRERRTFFRQELSRMVLFFSDQPSLIAPNIQVGSYAPQLIYCWRYDFLISCRIMWILKGRFVRFYIRTWKKNGKAWKLLLIFFFMKEVWCIYYY